ncbi:K02A2.6-like [Cordylochernes scorpioides]|uniref:K02A2.6-like n=1 Tax=Cordylochernes scorpioides TaxID=51811 RepID=A0ABY6KYT2_9ARAC|nr:K02A2.6-like [Cordylochernes scorpioides]
MHSGGVGVSVRRDLTFLLSGRRYKQVNEPPHEELARECRICQESASMPPATISEWTWPEKPWHRLHLDLADPFMGRMLLVLVDAYSKWI